MFHQEVYKEAFQVWEVIGVGIDPSRAISGGFPPKLENIVIADIDADQSMNEARRLLRIIEKYKGTREMSSLLIDEYIRRIRLLQGIRNASLLDIKSNL